MKKFLSYILVVTLLLATLLTACTPVVPDDGTQLDLETEEMIIKVESVADHRIEETFVTVKPKPVDEDDEDYDEDEDENGEKKKKKM